MKSLKNQVVYHKKYGEGIVQEEELRKIKVFFEEKSESKTFLCPDAFETHLTLKDSNLQNEFYQKALEQKEEREKEKQARLEEMTRLELEAKREKAAAVRKKKTTPRRTRSRILEEIEETIGPEKKEESET